MENKNNKLLQALRYSGAEKINEAYNWVQDNRHMFRAEVYGPVLLEVCLLACSPTIVCFADHTSNSTSSLYCCQVNVQDKVHASYLEGHVASYIWKV